MFVLRLSSQLTWELADGMTSVALVDHVTWGSVVLVEHVTWGSVVLVDHVTWGVRVWADIVASGQTQTAIKSMLHVKVTT